MLIPLTTVIVFSMIKDAFEDYNRHKNDDKENKSLADTFQKESFQPKNWQDVRVGEIIKVKCDEQIPCDIIIVHSSDPKGVCYTETKGLDGETNLKMKNAPKLLQNKFQVPFDLKQIDGEIICEQPNNAIYKFEGNIRLSNVNERIALGPENMLLRGCSLKNTEFIYGIAIFTGHDTKVMKNAASAKYKFSSLENKMNMAIGLILVTQLILSSIAAFFGAAWTYKAS